MIRYRRVLRYRCILRFSLDADEGTFTGCLAKRLKALGFTKAKRTGEYLLSCDTQTQLAEALRGFWDAVGNPKQTFPGKTFPPGVKLDHAWTYCSKVYASA